MKAITWHGKHDMRCDTVPDPVIEDGRDAIIKVSACAICGSDLHFYDGFMPGMKSGDIVGHEFMGEVMEVGRDNKKLKIGDRVVVPFTIVCGDCEQCKRSNFSVCERSNRNAEMAAKMFGHSGAGLYGYTHLTGGYSGGQAEYVRVPYADVGPVIIPNGMSDEEVLFLGDILPTGWQAAANCDIEPTDTVAIWGAGPVGLFAMQSAMIMGAKQVVVIDEVPERLAMAAAKGAITINFQEESVVERLNELTGGKGPEKCIDSVGMEAHSGYEAEHLYDRVKQAVMAETDRPHVLREMIYVCRPAGIISVPGVYGGIVDKIPFGAAMNKGLTFRMGQTHVNKWADDLLIRIQEGQFDMTSMITHRGTLEDAPALYKTFRDKADGCVKVVLKP
ncbi:zinc-dependent alcohol dehydrogenase [Aurantimonas endophytica]|uniref:Threonine dehydrogenase-like Zn-dependent dehydrogenase n=1 Tax=Aurantimonas endophytica TaxID=1522175 RepID=A0A7W6HD97_9HYPH|nr:zinc-dependent alcohol dehydrogenase [Aurantimonas endophytica]MBB4002947.1 threonine dehydrogenase-like Zn-dependent dehydrogenase [Aurantimonas endophytica]MCO6403823.1 alcohol dehydrogenase catalytic domain-containing protein [Aurantimonas endophytica]